MDIKRVLFVGAGTSSFIAAKADSFMSHIEQMWKGEEVKAINPSVQCLLYRNIRAVKERYPDEYQTFLDNDWILRDASGARIRSNAFPENWIIDVGNPTVQDWIANWFITNLGVYDGAYLDNCLPSTEILWDVSSKPAINPRTGQEYTSLEFRNDVITLVNTVKSAIAPKIIMGNGITTGTKFFQDWRLPDYSALLINSQIDAIMCEAWLLPSSAPVDWRTESEWKDAVDFVVWLENNFISRGKLFYPVVRNPLDWNNQVLLPPDCTQEQCVTFTFATLLLGASTSGAHYLNLGYYDSDYVSSLFALDVGVPLNSYYVVSGTHVYARDFSNAMALVNPTSQSYTVSLGKNYETIDGTPVGSSIVVGAHTGAILIAPTHTLSVGSTPIAAIPFQLNGTPLATPYAAALPEALYVVAMPSNVQVNEDIYNFTGWADGPTTPSREISLVSDTSLVAQYELQSTPPDKGVLQVHASIGEEEIVADCTLVETGLNFQTPATLEVDAGIYTIQARAIGKTLTQTTPVQEGQTIRIDFDFTPTPIPPLGNLLPFAFIGGVLYFTGKKSKGRG